MHSLRSGLFRSALGLLFTGAFDPPTRRNTNAQHQAVHDPNKTSTEKPEAAKQASRSNSVNHVILVGRLVADPQLRETGSGRHVTTIRIATNNRASAEFHNVVLWRQLADFATSYLKKGRLVSVTGRLQTRTWTAADGSTRYSVEVVANDLQALPSRSAQPAA